MKKTNRSKAKPKVQLISSPVEHRFDKLDALAASKLDLSNLDPGERAFLGTCQEIYRKNIGCYTPFESFFTDLVCWTRWGNPPTLESLRAQLADAETEFVHNSIDMLHGVKQFVRNYPGMIAEIQDAAKAETEQPAEAAHA